MPEKDQAPEIFASILDSTPQPSEFADTILAQQNQSENPVPAPMDVPGISAVTIGSTETQTSQQTENDDVFNPDIHIGGMDGNGVKTKAGKYRRKPGRKTGKSYPAGINSPQATVPPAVDPMRMERAKNDAQVATALTFTLGTVLLGEEGKPIIDAQIGVNEPEEFVTAYTQYFYLAGPLNLPPGFILAMTVMNYSVRRYAMPNTRNKIQRLFYWSKDWVWHLLGLTT